MVAAQNATQKILEAIGRPMRLRRRGLCRKTLQNASAIGGSSTRHK